MLSEVRSLVEGVPQGSIQSATPFAVAINSVISHDQCSSCRGHGSLYVDDLSISFFCSPYATGGEETAVGNQQNLSGLQHVVSIFQR